MKLVLILLLSALPAFQLTAQPADAAEAAVYVYTLPDGSIKFSSKPPPPGVAARVFTADRRNPVVLRRPPGKRWPVNLYADLIAAAARRHQLSPHLITGMIQAESGFNPYAVSPKGAQGLMQLLPEVGRYLGVRDPFVPRENIEAGTRHMAGLMKKYRGNLVLALAAYNAGESAVDRAGGIPPYRETRDYVRRVLQLFEQYRVRSMRPVKG